GAGRGGWWPGVSAALPRLAEALDAPVAHTWDGHAAMPTTHPLHLGMFRGDLSHPEVLASLRAADLVLGVGVRPGTEAARVLPGACGGGFVPLVASDEPDEAIPSVTPLAGAPPALPDGRPRPPRW